MTKKTDDKNRHAKDSDTPRRRLLKTVAASGTVFGLTALPGKWAKPVVASVMLPAHAQTSSCVGTLANCPSGFSYSSITSTPTTLAFNTTSITSEFSSISVTNGTLQGVASISLSSVRGPCPLPCGSPELTYYQRKYLSFGSGSYHRRVTLGARCGNELIGTGYIGINAGSIGGFTYTGASTTQLDICTYLFSATM